MSEWNQTKFEGGCNYWASNAGMFMWQQWDEEVVKKDLDALQAAGVTILRVFPLWSDFQPVVSIIDCMGDCLGYRYGEDEAEMRGDFYGKAGISLVMLERFGCLLDMAREHGMRCIVSIVTGWMSGREFVPPALVNLGFITSPVARFLTTKFIRAIVRRFKEHTAICAWELGNECNCLERLSMPEESWNWTSMVVSAIHEEDRSRPVLSGMHSLTTSCRYQKSWSIMEQGELCDCLTTHPYPLFTPHCSKGFFDELPSTYHAVAESCLYSDLGGCPCIIEEINSLGPFVAGPEQVAGNIRSVMFSAWAHGQNAYLWWCGFMQDKLTRLPYGRAAMERSLGLLEADEARTPTSAAKAMKAVLDEIHAFPVQELPPYETDAVVFLPDCREGWKSAFGAFAMGTQAGISIRFANEQTAIPKSGIYFVSADDESEINCARWQELLRRTREEGASLIVTNNGSTFNPFQDIFGCHTIAYYRVPRTTTVVLDGENVSFNVSATDKIAADTCEVLLADCDGNPLLTRKSYGKGQCFYCPVPLEQIATETPSLPLYRIYRMIVDCCGKKEIFPGRPNHVGFTRHNLSGKELYMVTNYSSKAVEFPLPFEADVYPAQQKVGMLSLPSNGTVMIIRKS